MVEGSGKNSSLHRQKCRYTTGMNNPVIPLGSSKPLIPIDKLPEIGDRIQVLKDKNILNATVISLAECCRLNPGLFGRGYQNKFKEFYEPDESIRAFRTDDGLASFCIMRFPYSFGGYEYNKNVFKPDS